MGPRRLGTAGLEGGVYRQMPAYVFLSLSSFPRGVFETPNCLRTLKLSLKEIIPNCEYRIKAKNEISFQSDLCRVTPLCCSTQGGPLQDQQGRLHSAAKRGSLSSHVHLILVIPKHCASQGGGAWRSFESQF